MPFEIGRVYVRQGMRGEKSKLMCEPLLAHGVGKGFLPLRGLTISRCMRPWPLWDSSVAESTVRYFGIEVEDALELSEQTEI